MYPLLIAAFAAKASKCDTSDFGYPEEAKRFGFRHLPLTSYCRKQAMKAIRETGGLLDFTPEMQRRLRWRASVPKEGYAGSSFYASRLHIFADEEGFEFDPQNPERRPNLRLVYDAPLCGPEFEALPLVLQLGIEMLIRKECRGSDPE